MVRARLPQGYGQRQGPVRGQQPGQQPQARQAQPPAAQPPSPHPKLALGLGPQPARRLQVLLQERAQERAQGPTQEPGSAPGPTQAPPPQPGLRQLARWARPERGRQRPAASPAGAALLLRPRAVPCRDEARA